MCGALQLCEAQTIIRSVSSFQSCVQLDPSLGGQAGVGDSLNCSRIGGSIPPVTVMQLTMTPGLATGSVFNIDLTTVLDNTGGPNTTADSSTRCNPSTPTTQACFATRTATMSIETSNPVFSYQLRRVVDFDLPYCYASSTDFEELSLKESERAVPCHSSTTSFETDNKCSTTFDLNTAPMEHAVMCALDTPDALSSSYGFGNRYQDPWPSGGQSNTDYLRGFAGDIDGSSDDTDAYIFAWNQITTNLNLKGGGSLPLITGEEVECLQNRCQGNVYFPKSAQDPSSALAKHCCLPEDVANNPGAGTCDSRNLDLRSPTLFPMPNPFGLGPQNLYDSSDRDESGYVRDSNIPQQTVWNSGRQHYTTVRCSSPNCPANSDARRRLYSTDRQDISEETAYVNTKHAILALPPTCTAYRVNPDPNVDIQVRIKVTTQDVNGGETTQTTNINNFRPGAQSSSDQLQVRARIENIASVDSSLGPSIDGYIVVCGRESAKNVPNMVDMRYLVPRDADTDISDIPVTTNPWPYLIEQYNNVRDADGSIPANVRRKKFFPHPFDYVQPGTRGKPTRANGGLGLDDDFGQTIWYFVPQDIALREWGSSCNQIGMSGAFGSSSSNRATLCRLPPHACAPGIGRFANGGQKTSLPCTVSGLFNYISGAVVPIDDIDLDTFLQPDSIFEKSLDDAMRFMPGDTIDELRAAANSSIDATSAQLYNPDEPNVWLADDKLIYEQSGRKITSGAITADIIIDFVGSFVSYDNKVSKGEILLTNNTLNCDIEQGGTAVVAARVKNVAAIGVGVVTSYRLSLSCNTTESGLEVTNPTGAFFVVESLPPSQISDELRFVLTQNGIPSQKGRCNFTLSSETDVILDPVMDQKSIECNQRPIAPPTPFIPPNTTDSPIQRAPCDRSCGMCHLRDGTWYESWCVLLFLGIGFSFILVFIVAVVLSVSLEIKFKTAGARHAKKSDDILNKLDKEEKRDKAQELALLQATTSGLQDDEPAAAAASEQ